MEQAKEMARVAFEALEDKKGEDTCVIDISHISVLADYFVISNGNSDSQVRALVDNVEEKMHKAGFVQKQGEGRNGGSWVLWIMAILSSMYLTGKTENFITWSAFGATEDDSAT